MQGNGPQYPEDDVTDPSGFLRQARRHQSAFRARYLELPFDTYGNYLIKEDGEKGKNFYDGFGIFEAVKKYRKYNKQLYTNMLRSEHIPFNFFIPLDKNKIYCKIIFSEIIKTYIVSIDKIEIEYAPKPKEKYLNDGTSFDTYIEYTSSDGTKGMIGIEIKYTEREYRLPAFSKQDNDMKNKNSLYFSVTNKSGLYREDAIELLSTDKFRQVWRNHILGESIILADSDKFKRFTSLTLFPAGNTHFIKTSSEYITLLRNIDNKFIALTYEDFFALLRKHCPDSDYGKWLDYLKDRYIVTNE
jgi:hypothetical protein